MRRAGLLLLTAVLLAGCGSAAGGGPSKAGGAGASDIGKAQGGPKDVDRKADGSAAGGSTPGRVGSGSAVSSGSANERGNLPATVGEPVRVMDAAGNAVVTLTVTGFTVDYPCPDAVARENPQHGHYVAVALEIGAEPGFPRYDNPFVQFTLANNGAFAIVGDDGITEEDLFGSGAVGCSSDGDGFLYQVVEAGQRYRGTVVVDSPTRGGTLVWRPVLTVDGPTAGWEWPFG